MRTVTASLLLLSLIATSLAAQDKKGETAAKRPRGKFTLSKETTYITSPLDKDGYPDYAAALNEKLRQGVMPENNANVFLWRAMGPHPEKATMPPEFFQLLGVTLPETGDYFVDLSDYAKEQLKIAGGPALDGIVEESYLATRRPWKAESHPNLAAWINANEKPLAVVAEATQKSQYYSPLTAKKTEKGPMGLMAVLMPGVQKSRGLANALVARAMRRAGDGARTDAWQDLLTCHRLGRLVSRGGTLIEALVGMAQDNLANNADLALLNSDALTAKQIQSCLRDLQKLPPMPSLARTIDLGERFFFLDTVMMVDRHGLQFVERLAGGRSDGNALNGLADSILDDVNWDTTLKNGNRWYDRLATAMREKNPRLRRETLKQLDQELRKLRADTMDSGNLTLLLVGQPKERDKIVGDLVITLLLPAVIKVQEAADRNKQTHNNVLLAFALAWYHADHGHYPKELAALSPTYLAEIPQDIFSGKPLLYRPNDKGYLLYSVGPNGQDDGGRSYEDEGEPRGDDIAVRMPLPPLPKK